MSQPREKKTCICGADSGHEMGCPVQAAVLTEAERLVAVAERFRDWLAANEAFADGVPELVFGYHRGTQSHQKLCKSDRGTPP